MFRENPPPYPGDITVFNPDSNEMHQWLHDHMMCIDKDFTRERFYDANARYVSLFVELAGVKLWHLNTSFRDFCDYFAKFFYGFCRESKYVFKPEWTDHFFLDQDIINKCDDFNIQRFITLSSFALEFKQHYNKISFDPISVMEQVTGLIATVGASRFEFLMYLYDPDFVMDLYISCQETSILDKEFLSFCKPTDPYQMTKNGLVPKLDFSPMTTLSPRGNGFSPNHSIIVNLNTDYTNAFEQHTNLKYKARENICKFLLHKKAFVTNLDQIEHLDKFFAPDFFATNKKDANAVITINTDSMATFWVKEDRFAGYLTIAMMFAMQGVSISNDLFTVKQVW